MASSAAIDQTFVPTPSELALLKAWRRLPTSTAAVLLAFNVAFLADHGLVVRASTLEESPQEVSEPLDEDPETS
jgi:hypothetical protein